MQRGHTAHLTNRPACVSVIAYLMLPYLGQATTGAGEGTLIA